MHNRVFEPVYGPAMMAVLLSLASCGANSDVSPSGLQPARPVPDEPTPARGPASSTEGVAVGGTERELDEREPTLAATPPPPITGGTLLITQDGATAVVADPARDVIHFVALADGVATEAVHLAAGARPARIAESPGAVHVVLGGVGQLLTLDLEGNIVLQRDVCPEPKGVAYLPSKDRVLLACRDGRLQSIPPAAGNVELHARLPTDLRDVVVFPNEDPTAPETVYVTRFRSAELIRVGADGTSEPALRPPVIEMLTTAVQPPEAFSESDEAPPVAAVTETLAPFAATVAWRALAVGAEVVMLHQRARVDSIGVSGEGGYGGGCERVVQPGLSKFGPAGGVMTSAGLATMHLAVDVAVSPGGGLWAVADAGGSDPGVPGLEPDDEPAVVQVFRHEDLSLQAQISDDVSCGPGSVMVLTATQGAQATAVAFNPQNERQLVVLLRQPAELVIHDDVGDPQEPIRHIALGGADITDTGHDLFHRVETTIACAHCHPEGAEDGHVWIFEELGPRRTQTLQTGLRPPLHWDGELSGMAELMSEVFVGRMSAAPQSSARIDALSRWLESLTPPAPTADIDAELAATGQRLFESAAVGCAACHHGAALSDGALHDVGTSDVPLKTPSLLGVAQRLPLMHDGCARTLSDRFADACGGGDSHGNTSQLTEEERRALVAYLSSL